ncbi:hypothetical protein SEVIR_6G016701v4 [Setaria viridis]
MSRSGGASRVKASYEVSVLDPRAILPPRSLSTTPPQYFVSDSGGADGRHCNHFSGAGVDLYRTALHDQCRRVCPRRLAPASMHRHRLPGGAGPDTVAKDGPSS